MANCKVHAIAVDLQDNLVMYAHRKTKRGVEVAQWIYLIKKILNIQTGNVRES